MTTANNTTENNRTGIIVAFHIGRGGRFHNPGHRSFIGEKQIDEFTSELFTRYENENQIRERFEDHEDFDKIVELMYSEDFAGLSSYGITADDLGQVEYYHGASGSSVGLTEKEAQTGIGTINIDHGYDTTYTCALEDCDENELKIIDEYTGFKSYELEQYVKEALGLDDETQDEE